ILIAGFSTFMPKFIEYQFGVTAGKAALFVVVPAGGGATFAGGLIVRFFNLKVRGILRLCIVASALLSVLTMMLLLECDTAPFAGVSLPYGETNTNGASFLGQKNLDAACNAGCECAEEDYYPMCGRDGVLYFSPCYAGCADVFLVGDDKVRRVEERLR
ncbi:solute carrier organic anion transporter family member 4A1-like, partial [Aplysia californica]|uniref:Solute carrier organic anion transporter family member 4A1-like n=1 Tax=Aplysia californica TaxID=6500 RepID=A0ABM1VYH2_APLCA